MRLVVSSVVLWCLGVVAAGAQQPLVPTVVRTPPVPDTVSRVWVGQADAGGTEPTVRAKGPAVRVQSTGAPGRARGDARVRGNYVVRAAFAAVADMPVGYGVSVSEADQPGATRLVCLLRAGREWAIERHGAATEVVHDWTPLADDGVVAGGDLLEIRVSGGEAQYRINGRLVATVPFAPAPDAWTRPAVQVGAGGEVVVSGFTLDTLPTGVAR